MAKGGEGRAGEGPKFLEKLAIRAAALRPMAEMLLLRRLMARVLLLWVLLLRLLLLCMLLPLMPLLDVPLHLLHVLLRLLRYTLDVRSHRLNPDTSANMAQ